MRIAIRNGRDGEWRRISISEQQDDSSLQELERQIPELISVEDLTPGQTSIKVCAGSLSDSSEGDGSFIGIDDSGRITIVECRAFNNPSNRSEIIGQVLECAALLWGMSYEGFDSMVADSEGRTLVEIMSEKVPQERWSETQFKRAVTSSLSQGRFRLLLAVPIMTDEIKRIVEFLSGRGQFSFETHILELQHFSDGEMEIVVPELTSFAKTEQKGFAQGAVSEMPQTAAPVGKPSSSQAEPTIGQGLSQESSELPDSARPVVELGGTPAEEVARKKALFFAKCQGALGENAVEMMGKLYEFSTEFADEIMWWGSGGAGAFNFAVTENQLTVFIVDANGRIMFNFSEWQREPAYRSLLLQFVEKLKDISILRQQKGDYTKWPDFSVEEFFGDENDFVNFENSVKFLKEELRKLAPA
jgi:hypothetical protein